MSQKIRQKKLKYIKSLGAELFSIFWDKMSQKLRQRKFLNYIKSSCIIFCVKMSRYS